MNNRVKLLKVSMWAVIIISILLFVVMIIVEHGRYSMDDEKGVQETIEYKELLHEMDVS